jgi:hypothetical protein
MTTPNRNDSNIHCDKQQKEQEKKQLNLLFPGCLPKGNKGEFLPLLSSDLCEYQVEASDCDYRADCVEDDLCNKHLLSPLLD